MKRYKGTFNWKGEIIVIETRKPCISKDHAVRKLTHALSKRLDKGEASIRRYFEDGPDRYRMEEI